MRRRLLAVARWLAWLKLYALVGMGIGAVFGVAWYLGAACGSVGYLLGELQRARIGAKLF